MIKNTDPAIAKAEALLEYLGSLEEIRRYYELREKEIHDEITRMTGARAEGREEGLAEGETKGVLKGKLETARNMLAEDLALPLIMKMTGLTEDDIGKLQMKPKYFVH